MRSYHLGSSGPEVARLQRRLAELAFYHAAADGAYGGGTESAVHAFQRARGIGADGVVGPGTWRALFGEEIPAPAIASAPLAMRCLALTASFETGAAPPDCFATVTGDFDQMGVSFGALQWNVGQGSLQALLGDLDAHGASVIDEVFHVHAPELRAVLAAPRASQLAWARSLQPPGTHRPREPWLGLFKALGRRPECHDAQMRAAAAHYASARALCAEYGVWSERAVALLFDIVVQNGSIGGEVKERIMNGFAHLDAENASELEQARLVVIANRRAEAARPQWVEDVRTRKLAIARGGGVVHGRRYDLAADYGIALVPHESVGPGVLPAHVGGAAKLASP